MQFEAFELSRVQCVDGEQDRYFMALVEARFKEQMKADVAQSVSISVRVVQKAEHKLEPPDQKLIEEAKRLLKLASDLFQEQSHETLRSIEIS